MRGRTFARLAFTLATAALCLAAAVIPAQAAAKAGWRLYQVYGTGANNIDAPFSNGLAVTSPHNAWSIFVGCNWPCSGTSNLDFLGHWNGGRWSPVPASQIDNIDPDMITARSSSNAWLFGYFPDQSQLGAVHWNGTSWTKEAVPSWAFVINGSGVLAAQFADFGPRNLWIFSEGGYIGQKSAYATRYVNGRWTKSYLPDSLDSVAALSSTNIWATGRAFNNEGPTVFMHWNGRKWSKVPIHTGQRGTPDGFFTPGQHELWLEWAPPNPKAAPFLLRKTRTGWSKVSLPRGYSGDLAVSDGVHGLWLSGFAPGKKRVQVFLHWSAGHWTIVHVPNGKYQPGNVDQLASVPGTKSVWAIGNVYGPGDGTILNRGAIWQYNP
jgi:hypothetical protein